ncbi:MAG: hypothetical protein COV44_04975 [Deltaproteobacteria bacterium CG11_big_fil_rev_8_21_14_0_20_45_16]|nr:MAG: hypothetical protein COV44_04975 [Deltaproteobacteria bacterium CG11_big_fil_rev_8_21_14_0_20_45_16]
MSSQLKQYLGRQKKRLEFYAALRLLGWLLLTGAVSYQLLENLEFYSIYIKAAHSLSVIWPSLKIGIVSIIAGLVLWRARKTLFSSDLMGAASRIEEESDYFESQKQFKTELTTAAAFLLKSESVMAEFEKAHIDIWSKRLGAYFVEIRPRVLDVGVLIVGALSLLAVSSVTGQRVYHLPGRVEAWSMSSYEERLPYAEADWTHKSGSLNVVSGSKIRFTAPDFGIWQSFFYVQEEGGPWTYKICNEYCEWEVEKNAQYAVGSLWHRSAKFPLLAIPDEAPKAVLFVLEGDELIPSAVVKVENKKSLNIQLLASDDIRLRSFRLLHRFEEADEVLSESEVHSKHFRMDYLLSMEEWKGGKHEIILKVKDDRLETESLPLTVYYADEEFMREQRIQNLRALVDEWVHILGDLIETNEDQRIFSELPARLKSLSYSEDMGEGLIAVYVEELKRLSQRIENELIESGRMSLLPELIKETEKQILYGLSLIFREKAGDLQSSTQGLDESRKSLGDLIQKLRDGKEKLSSEKIQKAFEDLLSKIEDLQNKIKNLPQGPQDEMLNREALDEQLSESEALEERIAEIQEMIANGQEEKAIKELESLMNQLGILSKEVERSMDQWQENFDQGAMQASEKFQNSLKEIREQQEALAEKTESLKNKQQNLEAKSQEDWKPMDEKDKEGLDKEFQEISKEQSKLQDKFQKITESFDKAVQGSDWEQVFRSQEAKDTETRILDRMGEATEKLNEQRAHDSLTSEQEAVDLLKKAESNQQKMREQVQKQSEMQMGAGGSRSRDVHEEIELLDSEGRGQKERRQKIMNSLRQKVEDRFQGSHERYFEDLLQR